jgi:hypothetical protein
MYTRFADDCKGNWHDRESCLDRIGLRIYGHAPSANLHTEVLRRLVGRRTEAAAPPGEDEAMNQRVWLCPALVFGLLGCAHQQTRMQAEEETDRDKAAAVKTVGDITSVGNADPVSVSGIGLVVGLDGTGGGAPAPYRQQLEDQLRKRPNQRGEEIDLKQILSSPNTSVVLVQALIPAGARKGDPLDIELTVPRESKTTSLRGGQLVECTLYNYETKKHLDKNYEGSDAFLRGHPVAKAEGPLEVGFGDGDEAAKLRQARIWDGGRCQVDRPFYLFLNNGSQFVRTARTVAERINETFQGAAQDQVNGLAEAKTKSLVHLSVPPQYRLNLPRYLRVVRLVPMWETEAARIPYHRWLEEQLLDPAHAVTAALRLEAMGQDSIPTLKRGLSSDRPLVRFCSAEALAYLGDPSCGEELARTIKEQPLLRAFSLTAMASLDEAVCHVELGRLLSEPSAETRYGAFRALRSLDENAEVVQGEHLKDQEGNESFWLHRVAPNSPALVHVSTRNRAEIVLFGEEPYLIPPFPILAGEFTITANKDDERCTITRISLRHGRDKRQCSLKLEEVLRTLAEMGCEYADAVELLRRANQLQCLSCPVAVDALPQAISAEELAKAGTGDSVLVHAHPEILGAGADTVSPAALLEQDTAAERPGNDEHKSKTAASASE